MTLGNGGIDFDSGGTGSSSSYTDEEAQDAVGGIFTSSTTVAAVYSDATPSITLHVNDAELLALSGTTSAANKVPYYTGSGAASTTDITPGAWIAFTPTLGGGWLLGNSTYVATYARIGRTIIFSAAITIGNTATIGSTLTVALPVTAASVDNLLAGINGMFQDVGTAANPAVVVPANTTTSVVELRPINAAGTYGATGNTVTMTVPFTWVTGDKIIVGGTYEAAS